jgi:hypothetical protein
MTMSALVAPGAGKAGHEELDEHRLRLARVDIAELEPSTAVPNGDVGYWWRTAVSVTASDDRISTVPSARTA